MFSLFHRYLCSRGQTLASSGGNHIKRFLIHFVPDCADGMTMQIRYLKLIDRLRRCLIDVGVRQKNLSPFDRDPRTGPLRFICPSQTTSAQRSLVVPDDPSSITVGARNGMSSTRGLDARKDNAGPILTSNDTSAYPSKPVVLRPNGDDGRRTLWRGTLLEAAERFNRP